MTRLMRETPRDEDAVEMLLDLTFAPGRRALSSYRLRDGVAPVAALCMVMRDEFDALAGCIRYWPVAILRDGAAGPDRVAPALLLGPVAVHPTRQGEGLGAVLITETLAQAEALGWARVVLVGDAPYYNRFGFGRALATGLRFPPPTNPDRVLARALRPGAFDGVAGDVARWQGGSAIP